MQPRGGCAILRAVKLLFLTQKRDAPSTRWRILQFIPHFERAGAVCTIEEWPAGMLARLSLARKAAGYDIVVLQKRLLPKMLLNRLRRNARALVYEFDDGVTLKRTAEGAVRESPTRERRFRRTVREADAVITTNEHLARRAEQAGAPPGRVHIFPPVIDLSRWRPKEGPAGPDEGITIGWMGTAQNLAALEMLGGPLARLCRRYETLRVKVVCDTPPRLPGVRLDHKAYSAEEEVADVRAFDVGIAPLVEDPWTRGKLSTKVLAYLAAGVPVVGSDVAANRLYLREGENGFLVGTLAQWEDRLARLLEDPALRREMGARARASAERDFSLEAAVPRYLELFRGLATAPPASAGASAP